MGENDQPGQNVAERAACLSREQMDVICDHVETYIGKAENILHENVSDIIHLDMILVEPSLKRNYYTLVTMGMSALPMDAPPELPLHKYAEIITCLPPDWDLSFLKKKAKRDRMTKRPSHTTGRSGG